VINGEKKFAVVYEAPTKLDYLFISKYVKQNISVWVIEPFYAHHHKKGIFRNFPLHLPAFVQKLIKKGKISLLKVEKINTRDIDLLSGEMAISVTEDVYPAYRKRHSKIIQYVSKILKSLVSDNAFKIDLCNRIAEFYSVNIMLHRIAKYLGHGPVIVYPDINVYSYLSIKKLLLESHQELFEHPNVQFPRQVYVNSFLERLKENVISMARLCAQTIASGFMGKGHNPTEKKKTFSHGVAIISPRQLRKNQRRPDFLIDERKILSKEVVYFPLIPLSKAQKKKMAELHGEVFYLPQTGRFFSNFHEWKTLLWFALKQNVFYNTEEVNTASVTFFNYFKWRKVLEDVKIKNFITHADFGIGHVGRNIALNQAGVQTWFFTDSMSHALIFREEKEKGMRMPYCAYLFYDYLVTWHDALAQYFKEHPGSFKQTHVIGCIWAEHIEGKKQTRKQTNLQTLRDFNRFFVLSCFDSTYLRNAELSYQEGIAFASHILQLVDECPDIYIIFKEKKERAIHKILDPVLGPRLIGIYNKMESHPRITVCSNQTDASEIIAISDMVASFSFTSTTFEALSANRPAIWHDPLGCYVNTIYGKAGEVVTHSYNELKTKVLEIKEMNPGNYRNPVSMNSPLMDPYRDGKAIDRFRDLLTSQ